MLHKICIRLHVFDFTYCLKAFTNLCVPTHLWFERNTTVTRFWSIPVTTDAQISYNYIDPFDQLVSYQIILCGHFVH